LIIDIRSRAEFNNSHIVNSFNLPLDELETRASHELPKDVDGVVICGYVADCDRTLKREGALTHCSLGESLLKERGFSRFHFVGLSIDQMKSAGMEMVDSRLLSSRLDPVAR
jgi:hypothetical protein